MMCELNHLFVSLSLSLLCIYPNKTWTTDILYTQYNALAHHHTVAAVVAVAAADVIRVLSGGPFLACASGIYSKIWSLFPLSSLYSLNRS